jgi:hypothetical protein
MRARSYVRVVNLSPLSRVALFKIRPAVAMEAAKKERFRLNEHEKNLVVQSRTFAGVHNEYIPKRVQTNMAAYATELESQGDPVRAAAIRRWCARKSFSQLVCNIATSYRQKNKIPKVSYTGPKLSPTVWTAASAAASMAAGGCPSASAAATVGGEGGSSRQPQKQPQKQPRGAPTATRRRSKENGQEMSDYELMRQANITRNQEIFQQLGLGAPPGGGDKGKAAAYTAPASEQPTTPEGQLYTDKELEYPSPDSSSEELDKDQRLAARAFLENAENGV